MFFFSGKKEKVKIIDRVFISAKAKTNALTEKLRNTPSQTIVTWFEETYDQLRDHLTKNNLSGDLYLAREISHQVFNQPFVFFEHHPLANKEYELGNKLRLNEMVFYTSLDEPFFRHFGGERIISLMEKMGFSENEAVENAMISNAIKNAQEKISKQIIFEHSARSQKEWFMKNLPQLH